MAAAQQHHQLEGAAAGPAAVRRRSAGHDRRERQPAAAPHPVLRQPARCRRSHAAAAPQRRAGDRRAPDLLRRSRRPAGRGHAQPRPGPGAPLSRPRAVPGHRLLLDLLPLLHPLAPGGRPEQAPPQPRPVGPRPVLHRAEPRRARRPAFRRRPADPARQQPGIPADAPEPHPARRVRAHRLPRCRWSCRSASPIRWSTC